MRRTTLRLGLICAALLVIPSACSTLVGDFDFQASSSSGGGGTGGASTSSSSTGGARCTDPSVDCPAPSTACLVATCAAGACDTTSAVAGTACSDGVGKVCDGQGSCVECNAPADCTPPAGVCVVAACTAGTCAAVAAPVGTPCSDGSGKVCDASGACVPCNVDADCPATGTACVTATCTAGACGTMVAAKDTPCFDGGGKVCNDGGACVACNADADCPVPATACIAATCAGGACSTYSTPVGTPCSNGGTVCDGLGGCVACNVDTDCAGFPDIRCDAHACVIGCWDGKQDGDETDVDCGGSCKFCSIGDSCVVNADCQSGFCNASTCDACVTSSNCSPGSWCKPPYGECVAGFDDGQACDTSDQCKSGHCVDYVCCTTSSCPACNMCNLDGTGTCSPMPPGPDLDAPGLCNDAAHTCDGAGSCKTVLAQSCAAGSECESGNCVDGVCCGAPSCPACNACNLDGTGTCTAMATGPDATAPSTCNTATESCDGAGACKKAVGQACVAGGECATGICTGNLCAARPPSCVGGGNGTGMDCGASGTSDCCASPSVPGGSFKRNYDGVWYTDASLPATVSSFRLDAHEVTVGRFRKFVSAVVGGWRPPAGAGKHAHLPGGGLNAGAETGWDPAWNANLPGTKAAWDSSLAGGDATWTPSAGGNERRPINYVEWPQAYAFCIWDGGFLPSDAEWNYAAAGGSEQRVYPWSSPPTSTTIDCTYANYINGAYCSATHTSDVGSQSPKGDGRWGHADLAGNMWELALDGASAPPVPCVDCATFDALVGRVMRGGGWFDDSSGVLIGYRLAAGTTERDAAIGIRCARTP